MSNKSATTLFAILALAAGLLAGIWFNKPTVTPPQLLQATRLPEPRELSPFELIDHRNAPFTQKQLLGHWSFLFFGYTHCPDVCPTTMSVLQQTASLLEKNNSSHTEPRFIFVSVDPERDTPKRLGQYVRYFGENFTGVTGTSDQIDALSKQLGIAYAIGAPSGESGYTVDHSASILLIDPQARFSAVLSPPHDAKQMASDLEQLASYYKELQ